MDENNHEFVPLSFTIPLAAEESTTENPIIGEEHVHFFAPGETPSPGTGCGNGSAAKPEAEPGNLCVYTAESEASGLVGTKENVENNVRISDPALKNNPTGAGASGAIIRFHVPSGAAPGGFGYAAGTWAVTAP